jgi:hypothetical protein
MNRPAPAGRTVFTTRFSPRRAVLNATPLGALSRNDAGGNRKTCGVVAATPSSQEVPAAPRRDAGSARMAHLSVSRRLAAGRPGVPPAPSATRRRSYYRQRSLSDNCIVRAKGVKPRGATPLFYGVSPVGATPLYGVKSLQRYASTPIAIHASRAVSPKKILYFFC